MIRGLQLVSIRVGLLQVPGPLGRVLGLQHEVVRRVVVVGVAGMRHSRPGDGDNVKNIGLSVDDVLGQPRQHTDVRVIVIEVVL